jgi:hypothetical protein
MTQEEKIEIIGGINDFYTRGIPRLGADLVYLYPPYLRGAEA